MQPSFLRYPAVGFALSTSVASIYQRLRTLTAARLVGFSPMEVRAEINAFGAASLARKAVLDVR